MMMSCSCRLLLAACIANGLFGGALGFSTTAGFSVSSTTTTTRPIQREFQLSALETSSSVTNAEDSSLTPSKTATTTTTPNPWKFRGFDCYAEVTTPSNNADSSSSASPWDKLVSSFAPNNNNNNNNNAVTDVVLIHGFGCSTTYWRAAVETFAQQGGYTVHTLDLLGQGQSAKPGRADGIEYSIDLWAELVDEYVQQFIVKNQKKGKGIVLMGNSLGSVVALSAATGDFLQGNENKKNDIAKSCYKGIGLYNCGVGMNSRNLLKDPTLEPWQLTLFTILFDTLDFLLFGNRPLITYVLGQVVTPDLLRGALQGLYPNGPDRVDEKLVQAFYQPAKDPGSPECLNQIYTNDAGKTPQELHQQYTQLGGEQLPIHVVWGTQDNVTPLAGPVGQFYQSLANDQNRRVSMVTLEAGHVPFDEVPACNDSMLTWLKTVGED